MKEGMILTIDDLITGLAEKQEHEKDHEDLKAYFDHRAELLCDLFGCDLARREKELDAGRRARRPKAASSRSPERSKEEIEAAYEVNGRLTLSFLKSCIHHLNRSWTPGGIFLEGMPPKIQRDLLKQYGPAIRDRETEIKQLYRLMIRDLLEYLFPGIVSKTFPGERLFEMGLPREKPDITDYF